MVSSSALTKMMGITFILIGVFFFVVGLLMMLVMGSMTTALATLSAIGGGAASGLGTMVSLGWLFSLVTFAAGILSIITAILLFVVKR